jgi:polyisoprenoid-binding protein YceI
MRTISLSFLALLLTLCAAEAQTSSAVPVFTFEKAQSSVKFRVDSSITIDGTFDQWQADLTFASPEASTASLKIKVYAASVDTGSSLKDNTLKGSDFFDVQNNPYITFESTKVMQTGPASFEVDGNFTIRGVTKPEKLTLTVSGAGTGSGHINGTMAFDRRDYGMNSGIPFIRIANRVEVSADLYGRRIAGPPVVFKR